VSTRRHLMGMNDVDRADIERILETADGIIVGTSLKIDGKTQNRVDPERAKRMVDLARVAREHHLERVADGSG